VPLLPLSEHGAQTDPIQILNIDGLGPVKANVNTSPFGSIDGEAFHGASIGGRNIVITFGLNPDWDTWSMDGLRRLLYQYFIPKHPIRLVFQNNDDLPAMEIRGYVETVEPNMFTKDVEVQVSIICPDPYFNAVEPTILSGTTNDPIEINYTGSIEVGVFVKVVYGSSFFANTIGIQIGNPSETFFEVWGDVSTDRYFLVSSIPGNKYVRVVDINTGAITNLLHRVTSGSAWPTIKPGLNDFTVLVNGGVHDWELVYYEKHGAL
jgi:hypothetical protein